MGGDGGLKFLKEFNKLDKIMATSDILITSMKYII
jgi:hypothetical protein